MNTLPRPAARDKARILVYSTPWCADCHLAKRVLAEAGIEYDEIDIDSVPGAAEEVLKLNHGMRSVPTIIFPDGSVLVEPSRRELLARLQ
ncbi:MAG: mycoredoxin [Chloroflexota bacterium]|nr:mycoredoxin [Chloroflexota bacterium]